MASQEAKETLIKEFKEASRVSDWCDKAWLLAQVLTELDAPSLAKLLQYLRTEAMKEIEAQLGHPVPGEYTFKPIYEGKKKYSKHGDAVRVVNSWKVIDITPEVARNPQMHSISVSTQLARRLRKAIREQIWLLKRYE